MSMTWQELDGEDTIQENDFIVYRYSTSRNEKPDCYNSSLRIIPPAYLGHKVKAFFTDNLGFSAQEGHTIWRLSSLVIAVSSKPVSRERKIEMYL